MLFPFAWRSCISVFIKVVVYRARAMSGSSYEEPIHFECQRCGKCCTGLVIDKNGSLEGLAILPHERELFPKNFIEPHLGMGYSENRIERIMQYQVNVDVCPHLGEENECTIYATRPLTCRRFPLVYSNYDRTRLADTESCKAIAELEAEFGLLDGLFSRDTFICDDCWNAHFKFDYYIRSSEIDMSIMGYRPYSFDLKTRKWYPK